MNSIIIHCKILQNTACMCVCVCVCVRVCVLMDIFTVCLITCPKAVKNHIIKKSVCADEV